MTLVAAQIRVAGAGEVFVAPLGSTAPTDVSTALAPAFVGLGYDSDNGLTISRSMTINSIGAWQTLVPVRRVPTDQAMSVAAEFMQSNPDVAALYMSTSAFTAISGHTGETKASADINPAVVNRAVVFELEDGPIKYRYYIPKAEVSANGDQTASHSAAILYPLMFTAIAPDTGTILFDVFTNDPAMVPAG